MVGGRASRGRRLAGSPRSGPPASQYPGAREAIADFLRVAGNPQTIHHAFLLVSWYRRTPLGRDRVLKWIGSFPAITSHTAADFGLMTCDDEYDLATQHVHLTLPDGWTTEALITANVELDDNDMPFRWGINHIAVGESPEAAALSPQRAPDTS